MSHRYRNHANESTSRRYQCDLNATAAMANPPSAPVLARMVSQCKRQSPRASTNSPSRLQNARSGGQSRVKCGQPPAASKYGSGVMLWMSRPPQTISPASCIENGTVQATKPIQVSRGWPDLQTNNSTKESAQSSRRKSVGTVMSKSSDYELTADQSEFSALTLPENTSAMAKGADAMVKMSLSRSTEIIDTSKLVEEGKVGVEYYEEPEIFEEQDHAMVDEYEKGFAYARRLRDLLNMKFTDVDRGGIEKNFLLVKAHEHPTQKMIDLWRRVDMGFAYNDQVRLQKLIDDSKAAALNQTSKKDEEVYPDLLRFTVRIRKDNSEKRWNDYLAFRRKAKKLPAYKDMAVPKRNDKYLLSFLDVWSFCIVVFVKPSATVREIVDPVLSRLGLEGRADLVYTIGCFQLDKRAGKAKFSEVPALPEEVKVYETAAELNKKNCTEIYVNDNRCEIFGIFPEYYLRGMPKKKLVEKGTKKSDKKANGNKAEANKGKDIESTAASTVSVGENSYQDNKSNAQLDTMDEKQSASSANSSKQAAAAAAAAAADLGDEAAIFEEANGKLLSPVRRLTISDDELWTPGTLQLQTL